MNTASVQRFMTLAVLAALLLSLGFVLSIQPSPTHAFSVVLEQSEGERDSQRLTYEQISKRIEDFELFQREITMNCFPDRAPRLSMNQLAARKQFPIVLSMVLVLTFIIGSVRTRNSNKAFKKLREKYDSHS